MPDPINVPEKFFQYLKCCEGSEGADRILAFLSTLPILTGKKVLNFGCGNGCFAAALSLISGMVVGVTPGKEHADELSARYGSSNLSFIPAPDDMVPFPDASWDVVIVSSLEGIIGKTDDVLKEIRRVLKKDGLLITCFSTRLTDDLPVLMIEDGRLFGSFLQSMCGIFRFTMILGEHEGDFSVIQSLPPQYPWNEKSASAINTRLLVVFASDTPFCIPCREGIFNGLVRGSTGPGPTYEEQKRIAFLESVIEKRDQELRSARTQIEEQQHELVELKRSVLVRCIMLFHTGIVEPLMGHQTRRRRYYDTCLAGLRTVANEGISGLIWHARISKSSKGLGWQSRIRRLFSFSKIRASQSITRKISIIIPTKNAGPEFAFLLEKIRRQKGVVSTEILVIDSGSTDGTVALARSRNCYVIEIAPGEFHHGETRNFAAAKAGGEYFVFTVQDAIPCGEYWLRDLLLPLEGNTEVSAATCRQIPRSDADLFACYNNWANYQAIDFQRDKIVAAPPDHSKMSLMQWRKLAQIDDVCSAFRAKDFLDYRFATNYAEDLDIGVRLLKDGHKLAFIHSAAVIHSHNRTAAYFFKRSYSDSYALTMLFPHDGSFDPHGRAPDELLAGIIFLYHVFISSVEQHKRHSISELNEDPIQQIKFVMKNEIAQFNSPTRDQRKGNDSMDALFKELQERILVPPSTPDRRVLKLFFHSLDTFHDFRRGCGNPQYEASEIEDTLYKLFAAASGVALGGYSALLRNEADPHVRTSCLESIHAFLTEGI